MASAEGAVRLLRLAWRNVMRNRRRTLIAASAVGMGLAAMIFYDGTMEGTYDSMVVTATATWTGQGQIYREGYPERLESHVTVESADSVMAGLRRETHVRYFTPRVEVQGMVSSAAGYASATVTGISPPSECRISRPDDAVTEGAVPLSDRVRGLLIGHDMADDLELAPGDRAVVTVSMADSGGIHQEMVRISGVYHTGDPELDGFRALVPIDLARSMAGLDPSAVNRIVLVFDDLQFGADTISSFWDRYSRGANVAVGWPELVPQVDILREMSGMAISIVGLILFGLVAFGVVNTLFMSIYERMFEFGVLRAIGTTARRLGAMIVLESACLAAVSLVIGSALGLAAMLVTGHTGLDFTGIEFSGVTFYQPIYPVLRWQQFVLYPAGLVLLTTLTGVYPAVHAARRKPAEAMRRSL